MIKEPYGFLVEEPAARRHWSLSKLPAFVIAACVFATVMYCAAGTSKQRGNDADAQGTFHTQNLIVDTNYAIGSVGSQSTVNGPTLQSFAVPNTAYAFGEINREEISGVVPTPPNDLFVHVIRNHATADCTAADHHSGALAAEIDGTRTAGAHDLKNTAFECSATGGQNNECIHVLAGDFNFDGGGAITQNSGTAFFGGSFLAATGPMIAEYGGGPIGALYISADPGPTHSIYSNAADPSWDAHHATLSVLTLTNDSGPFELKIAGPALSNFISPNGVPAVNHGTISTKATDWIGNVTAIGANTSITLTYTQTYPNGSECQTTAISHAVATEIIEPNPGTHTVTFSCFSTISGAAANCDDFTYSCVGF